MNSLRGEDTLPTALVVDDDSQVLEMVRLMVKRVGFIPYGCRTFGEALDFFTVNHSTISFVIADYSLPDGNGKELIRKMREIDPSVRTIIASGYSRDDAETGPGQERVADLFMEKPYTFSDLKEAVARLMEGQSSR